MQHMDVLLIISRGSVVAVVVCGILGGLLGLPGGGNLCHCFLVLFCPCIRCDPLGNL